MGIAQLLVLSNPAPGREEEYNIWYSGRHLPDVLQVPGIVSATRLRIAGDPIGSSRWNYAALYTVDHDDPQSVLADLMERAGSPRMPLSDALDLEGLYAAIYEPFVDECLARVSENAMPSANGVANLQGLPEASA